MIATEWIDRPAFQGFPKISRFFRPIVITEKIDGTNAQIYITEDGQIFAGSRKRWLTPEDDNYGFAAWVEEHANELRQLGPGKHFGEWWGKGIQRNYGLTERRFSLFNVSQWKDHTYTGFLAEKENYPPVCCHVVPVLRVADSMNTPLIFETIGRLGYFGSLAAPGYMKPEGIVIFHAASGNLYKYTLDSDGHKGE